MVRDGSTRIWESCFVFGTLTNQENWGPSMKKGETTSAWCVFDGLIGYLLILVNQLVIVYTILFYGRYWLIQLENRPWFVEFFFCRRGVWDMVMLLLYYNAKYQNVFLFSLHYSILVRTIQAMNFYGEVC